MKKLSLRVTFAAVVAVALMFGDADASARYHQPTPKSGVVMAIDRPNRIIVVVEQPGGRAYRIRVPKNAKVATTWSQTRGSAVSFELLHIGLQYRGIVPE